MSQTGAIKGGNSPLSAYMLSSIFVFSEFLVFIRLLLLVLICIGIFVNFVYFKYLETYVNYIVDDVS